MEGAIRHFCERHGLPVDNSINACSFFNQLLTWHIKKEIHKLHTRDGKEILCLDDVKRLWDGLKLKKKTLEFIPPSNFETKMRIIESNKQELIMRTFVAVKEAEFITWLKGHLSVIESYLFSEHNKSLKELS